jgi:hypothetical protein
LRALRGKLPDGFKFDRLEPHNRRAVDAAISRLKALRKGSIIGPDGWKSARDEGRR